MKKEELKQKMLSYLESKGTTYYRVNQCIDTNPFPLSGKFRKDRPLHLVGNATISKVCRSVEIEKGTKLILIEFFKKLDNN